MIRPLKDLLQEADRFLAPESRLSKEATSLVGASSPEIMNLADQCISVDQILTEGALPSESIKTASSDFEKLALAVNRLHAQAQIEELKRFEELEKRASEEGYTQYQIGEAFAKVAAKKIKAVLPILVAAEGYSDKGPDLNTFDKKKVPSKSLPNKENLKDASKVVGE